MNAKAATSLSFSLSRGVELDPHNRASARAREKKSKRNISQHETRIRARKNNTPAHGALFYDTYIYIERERERKHT